MSAPDAARSTTALTGVFPCICHLGAYQQTRISLYARITLVALGIIAITGGLVVLYSGLMSSTLTNQIISWSSVGVGLTMVCAGSMLKCVEKQAAEQQIKKNNKLVNRSDSRIMNMFAQEIPASSITDASATIERLLPNILQRKPVEGLTLHPSTEEHRVFSLEGVDGLIFKMHTNPENDTTSNIATWADRCHRQSSQYRALCVEYHLYLIEIPATRSFTIHTTVRGVARTYNILAETRLAFQSGEGQQEALYEEAAKGTQLDKALQQLTTFVIHQGHSTFTWDTIPILEKPDAAGNLRVGLITFTFSPYDEPKVGLFGYENLSTSCEIAIHEHSAREYRERQRGLLGCVDERQGGIILAEARRHNIMMSDYSYPFNRQKEIEENRRLQQFFEKRQITTGTEQLDVEEFHAIDYNRSLAFHTDNAPETVEKYQNITQALVEEINRTISTRPTNMSLKARRRISINTLNEPYRDVMLQQTALSAELRAELETDVPVEVKVVIQTLRHHGLVHCEGKLEEMIEGSICTFYA